MVRVALAVESNDQREHYRRQGAVFSPSALRETLPELRMVEVKFHFPRKHYMLLDHVFLPDTLEQLAPYREVEQLVALPLEIDDEDAGPSGLQGGFGLLSLEATSRDAQGRGDLP